MQGCKLHAGSDTTKTAIFHVATEITIRSMNGNLGTRFKVHIGPRESLTGRTFKVGYTKDNLQRSIYKAYNQMGSCGDS